MPSSSRPRPPRSISPPARSRSGWARTPTGRRGHRVDRRAVAHAGLGRGGAAAGPRSVDVRHVRRVLLPRPGDRGRRRRRLRVEEALFLTKFATKVTVIHRRDTLRASKIMQERAFANARIDVPVEHRGDGPARRGDARGRPACENVRTGETSVLPVSGLFVAIGHRPNTDLFKGLLDMDDAGYLVTQPGSTLHERRGRVRLRRRRKTTRTARRSPRPVPAAWPRSTPSAGWKPADTADAPARADRPPEVSRSGAEVELLATLASRRKEALLMATASRPSPPPRSTRSSAPATPLWWSTSGPSGAAPAR